MDAGGLIRPRLLLFVSICVCVVTGSPLGTSNIDCTQGSRKDLGTVDEGYTGDVELVNGIAAGSNVKLVPFVFESHLQYLELSFTIGQTSATVRTKKPLSADALADNDRMLRYSVMCDGPVKYNNTRTLTINDLNNNRPIFQQKHYIEDVSETLTVGSDALRVIAVDGDSTPQNNRVTYSISPAPEDFTFTGGLFQLKNRLNYNVVQKYNFVVTASDNGGLTDTADVTINVVDFDDFNPHFSQNVYRAFIPENQAGPFRTIEPEAIKALDGDTGINMTLTYSISAVSPEKYRTNFDIDSSSGVVSVRTSIDREEMSSSVISVSIKAAQTDNSLKTANAQVSVTVEDVNDNPPEFDQGNYSVSLLENSPVDVVVFRAIVNDLDQGGFVGTLRILPESAPFSIGSDGTVRVKNSTALDRETTEEITFQIEAKEKDPPNRAVLVSVSVTLLDENDNSPVFTLDKYEGKVFANQTVGMQLVQVEAEDPDAGANGRIKYSIIFGNNDGYFSIDENNGQITLAKTIPLEDGKILEFPLYIRATDEGAIPRSSSAQVNIRAPGNLEPQFLKEVYHGTIEEEQEPGVTIVKVNFLSVAPVTLRVETEADKFEISNDGTFATKVKLDYDEAPHNYSVRISISDGTDSNTAVVEVRVTDINDNSPVFTPSSVTVSVPEDAEVGSNVTVVPATDKDSGFNKELRYSLRGGEGRFTIDPVSGRVSMAAALDRETEAEYNLLVVAEDQGRPARSATASLLVQVSDVNDNVPKFSEAEYQVEVLETESAGTSLLTLSAADPDEGANGRVTYSILEQSPSSEPAVFELESSNGTLQLVRPLDYSEVKMYTLTVQASDGGTPSLVGIGSVVVKVKDVNNNPPEFSQESYDVAVPENLASGVSIVTLEVTDKDEGGFSNGHFLFTCDTFDISKEGVVSLKKDVTLDRETRDSYIIPVVAVDQETDGLSSTAQLNVTVQDYNDNAPQFPPIPDPLQIPEGDYTEESPREIVTIVPTDADLGLNGEVTLSLVSPHPSFRFREDGTLLAVGPLDREKRETYELLVKASDKGSPQRENVTTIRVSLTDVNDNRPEFIQSSYVSSILLKDAEKGKLLLTLSATDRDAGKNSLITYSFSAGSSPYLALDGETGDVTLTSDLSDVTEGTTLVLTAMAEDHGEPPLNSTARVEVNLMFVSLEGVVFSSSSYNFSLPENQAAGAAVGKVLASSGSDLYNVTYKLKTHTDLFSMNASGSIETRAQLDTEEQEWFTLDVEAVDTRTPPTTAFTTVTVQVEDVNESPKFSSDVYEASVFNIAPYKSSVIYVKASDPDVGEDAQLVYSTEQNPLLDVDPSSGLVYVVSVAGLADPVTLEVKVTDPRGLHATTKVQVEIKGGASSSNVVIISLNQPANIVEKKIQDLEKSLETALGWTVDVIHVSNTNGEDTESKTLRTTVRTLVSFVAVDGGEVVSSKAVREKVQNQPEAVTEELVKVFGDGVNFQVEPEPQGPDSSQAVVIALGVVCGMSVPGLIVAVAYIGRSKRALSREKKPDKESFGLQSKGDTQSHQGESDKESISSQDFITTFKGPSETSSSESNQRESDKESLSSQDFIITFKGPSESRPSQSQQRESDRASVSSQDFITTFSEQVSEYL